MESAGVLVLEDDEAVRNRLCDAISRTDGLSVMAEAGTLEAANTILKNKLPCLALIDLGLPDGSGIDLIHHLTKKTNVPTLVLTVFGDENHVVSAIKAGACGYLLKSEPADKIGIELLQVLKGESPVSAAVARHILKQLKKRISVKTHYKK